MDSFTHGLILTIVGMGLVFLALAILLLSMIALARFLPDRKANVGSALADATSRSSSPEPSEAELAAIGAALAIWLQASADGAPDPQLGTALASGPSPWGVAARGAGKSLP